ERGGVELGAVDGEGLEVRLGREGVFGSGGPFRLQPHLAVLRGEVGGGELLPARRRLAALEVVRGGEEEVGGEVLRCDRRLVLLDERGVGEGGGRLPRLDGGVRLRIELREGRKRGEAKRHRQRQAAGQYRHVSVGVTRTLQEPSSTMPGGL